MITCDKLEVWQSVVKQMTEELGFEAYNILQKYTYLDSLEARTAIIGFKSQVWLDTFESKGLLPVVTRMLGEILQAEIRVKLVIGRPELIIPPAYVPLAKQTGKCKAKLDRLHAQYGWDIMSIVLGHPMFVKAATHITKGGWGLFPQILTLCCHEHGILNTLNALEYTATLHHVEKPRAYFLKILREGKSGYSRN